MAIGGVHPSSFTISIAMGVGVGGALVDVSSSVAFGSGIARSWGKQDEFRDTVPGRFSFTLDNHDGRYTPGNLSSVLATTVTERMPVVFNMDSRLIAGSVLAIELAGTEASWGEVTITCDDMLGNASRRLIPGLLAEAMVFAASPYLYWPMNDAAGSTIAAEKSGNRQLQLGPLAGGGALPTVVFGATGVPAVQDTQVALSDNATIAYLRSDWAGSTAFATIPYAASSMGSWGFWYTPTGSFSQFSVNIYCAGLSQPITIAVGSLSNGIRTYLGNTTGPAAGAALGVGVPHYIAMTITTSGATITCTLYVDGVSYGSGVYSQTVAPGVLTNAQRTPAVVSISVGDGSNATSLNISHLSHTATLVREDLAGVLTAAGRITAIDLLSPDVTLGALPGDLSTAAIGYWSASGSTGLDALNAVIRTEQGSLYTATTGSLLAPVQTVAVRARQRPGASTVTVFDAATELSDVPQFLRDVTNMFSTVTVTGSPGTATVTDATLIPRVGVASTSETVLNTATADLTLWGQDRLVRGKNVNLRVATISVDAVLATAATTAKLLALKPGDRIRITSLDATVLGFSTWDGWLLGVSESHSVRSSLFVLSLSPVLPDTAVFDTNLFMADGALTLTAGIASAATSMSVATTGPLLETVAVPYTLLIDSEQVTVTACTTGSPQVATITRGVNGTTAATHATGATPDVTPSSLLAF